jgi:tRNA threonylcarbamoyladenosine modification (KEOPS) complex  Pcc1 subunit
MSEALSATILYPYDKRILTLFEPESKILSRSSYEVTHDEKNIIFSVIAADATSLRAALTTITKVLSVWETTRDNGTSR